MDLKEGLDLEASFSDSILCLRRSARREIVMFFKVCMLYPDLSEIENHNNLRLLVFKTPIPLYESNCPKIENASIKPEIALTKT